MSAKFRTHKGADGLHTVWELDPVQTSDDPIEFTYSRYPDIKFIFEDTAKNVATHLNLTAR